MTSQAGWHPDPVPPAPGAPAQLRYWDGARWTEHTAPAQAPAATQQYAAAPAYYQGTYGAAYAGGPRRATTPDGVPLAGWWMRVLALVIDTVILGIVGALLTMPWLREVWHTYRDWIDEAIRSSENGTSSTIDTGELQGDLARPLAIIGAVSLALGFVYHVGFLMWKQASIGKLIVGLRVRLRARPGPMPLGTVLLRWLAQYGVGIIGLIPVVGAIGSLYTLLDYLWPLWDTNKQAIHDKVARTNVVRVR